MEDTRRRRQDRGYQTKLRAETAQTPATVRITKQA